MQVETLQGHLFSHRIYGTILEIRNLMTICRALHVDYAPTPHFLLVTGISRADAIALPSLSL